MRGGSELKYWTMDGMEGGTTFHPKMSLLPVYAKYKK